MDDKKIYTIDEIRDFSRSVFQEYDFINKAYLFGSYARNEAAERSDIDIYVEVDYSKRIGAMLHAAAYDLEEKTGKKVDLLTVSEVKTMRTKVLEEGVPIYERMETELLKQR